MAEYIERAEVLKKFEEIKSSVDITFADALYLDGVMELIDSVPSADVVEVVRCKDCKYMGWTIEPEHKKLVDFCPVWDSCVYKSDFCSHGVRKEDNRNE